MSSDNPLLKEDEKAKGKFKLFAGRSASPKSPAQPVAGTAATSSESPTDGTPPSSKGVRDSGKSPRMILRAAFGGSGNISPASSAGGGGSSSGGSSVAGESPPIASSPSAKAPKGPSRGIESIQKLVSKSKRRFVDKEHGFNLDLSYIGDRIIAMGFPSDGKEAAFRNPRTEVYRLLETFHKDHYKVYNLCSERTYDAALFNGRVAHFPFDDHNCPPMPLIYECCRDIDAWMKDHPKNIAAIHCKAGKGRTGLIIACWLQYNNEWPDANKALAFYAAARTHNQKGVTIPSQLRYVHYFGEALRRKGGYEPPEPKTLLLKELILHDFVSPGELRWTVEAHGISGVAMLRSWKDAGTQLRSAVAAAGAGGPATPAASRKDSQDVSFALHPPLPLRGDVRISCVGKPVLFHFWFSTAMVGGTSLTLPKSEIDKANKDKRRAFPPTFRVQLVYEEDTSVPGALKAKPRAAMHDEGSRKKLEYRFPSLLVL